MSKASASERNKRVNVAISLLRESTSNAEVTSELRKRFGISQRQAQRYVHEAAKAKQELPIPEQKIVFTVKLPITLVQRVRGFAKSTGESISDVTARALEHVLSGGEESG
ncbi:hypothetical protein GWO13_05885 [Candidatus Bathyarchaeota archaeon]|nr:hypothetical protein [Candidatus Bathyarchaeota archaeon]